ncbi:MAG: TRAP transporter small permease subunit [Thermovirgaceae bacterium]|nr:TRAP transporter small permease subunit [Thermovirgaceae bacterium]
MSWFSGMMKKLFAMLAFLENMVCYTGLLLITFLVFFNVLNRYWFRFEIMWVGDFALYVFMIFVFFSIMLTTREHGHTSVEVFAQKLFRRAPKAEKPYKVFLIALSILTAGIFTIPVYNFAARSFEYPEYGTLVRWFNTSWIMQSMFVMMLLVIAHLIQTMLVEIQIISSQGNPGKE